MAPTEARLRRLREERNHLDLFMTAYQLDDDDMSTWPDDVRLQYGRQVNARRLLRKAQAEAAAVQN